MEPTINPYANFESASCEVLQFLHHKTGFGLWMVTRTLDNDWIVLTAEDHKYQVKAGDVFKWNDSFCSRMVQGHGPRLAPCSDDIPAYASAPIGEQVPIGAYIGVPLARVDGSLFGTMCAIDPMPMPPEIVCDQPLIEMLAKLLATVLEADLKAEEQARIAERVQAESMLDPLTGIYNRRGWERFINAEQQRCERYGHSACVVSIDLDELKQVNDTLGHAMGDNLLRTAANALSKAIRQSDVLARLGGDEFAILAIECGQPHARELVQRIQNELKRSKVAASVGYQLCGTQMSLTRATAEADRIMYENKRRRKQERGEQPSDADSPNATSSG